MARERGVFAGLMLALVGLAWLSLWVWGESPYGRFLSHDGLAEAVRDGPGLLLVFLAGWTLMTAAMMLPTSLPLLAMFHAVTARRANRARLVGLAVAGYLGSWALCGALVHAADLAVHEAVERSAWLAGRAWVIPAGTLLLAGTYQLTPLKYRCLDQCRSPLGFVMAHWQSRRPRAEAFRLGVRHGVFCVGCCWALMLLMFGVGVGNLGWMLGLGVVMAVEKNLPWGRRLGAPLGVGLIGSGIVLAALSV